MTGLLKDKRLTSIVAIDRHGAIGCQNELPWKLKTDMAFFKTCTIGNAVIMGRKTYDSIGCCLPKRTNIVLSHNNILFNGTPQCQLAMSIQESLYQASSTACEEVFVVGGALTYSQFAPLVDRYLVTIVDYEVPGADAFLDESILASIQAWGPTKLSDTSAQEGIDEYAFSIYEVPAPDAEQRSAERTALIEQYAEQLKRPKRRKPTKRGEGFSQDAFAF